MSISNGKNIIEYIVNIKNISPLIIANEDDEPLIDEEENKVYIPGTTIAGALKSYIKKNFKGVIDYEELFPENNSDEKGNKKSKIFCYDSSADVLKYEIRPAVSINDNSGANDNKFERIFLSRGHEFSLKLELYNDDKSKLSLFEKIIDSCIVAINEGDIVIGSYKSIGAGVFKVESIRKRRYDFNLKLDIFSYLKENKVGEEIKIEELKKNSLNTNSCVTFELIGKFRTPVLIKGYSSLDSNDTDGIPLKDSNGKYIIPGSSIKGVIRGESKRILSYFNKVELLDKIFGSSSDSSNEIGAISKLTVFDSIIDRNLEEIIYNKIHIDKFTGGVIKSALMDDTTIKGDILIKAKYQKSNDDELNKHAIALISLIFRNIAIGDLPLGGGNNVGRGRITADSLIVKESGVPLFKGNINKNEIEVNKLNEYIECLSEVRGNNVQ